MEIIPAIDIINGKCVRLFKGQFDSVTDYGNTPADQAVIWEEQGAGRIHIINLEGASKGNLNINLETVKEICRRTKVETELGGGIRSKEDVDRAFETGIDYLILGTVIVKNPEVFNYALDKYKDKIIAGIDGIRTSTAVEGWLENTDISIFSLAEKVCGMGVKRIIFTDIDRDGTKAGPNIETTRRICEVSSCEIIAAGGISSYNDIENFKSLVPSGLKGVITGKALYEGLINLEEAINRFHKS